METYPSRTSTDPLRTAPALYRALFLLRVSRRFSGLLPDVRSSLFYSGNRDLNLYNCFRRVDREVRGTRLISPTIPNGKHYPSGLRATRRRSGGGQRGDSTCPTIPSPSKNAICAEPSGPRTKRGPLSAGLRLGRTARFGC